MHQLVGKPLVFHRDIDDSPYTPERLAAWLEAKYRRHGEEEDQYAAEMLRWFADAPPTPNEAAARLVDHILRPLAEGGGTYGDAIRELQIAAAQTPESASPGTGDRPGTTSDAAAPDALQHTCLTRYWDRTCLACRAEGKNQPTFAGDDGTLEIDEPEPVLPADLVCDGMAFRKGVALSTVARRINYLREAAFGPMPSKEEQAANLARLQSLGQPAPDGRET